MAEARTSDRGHRADRVASVRPEDLHQAIAAAAAAAIRSGVPAELLDGYEQAQIQSARRFLRDRGAVERTHLETEIAQLTRLRDNARANANLAEDDQTRRDFVADADRATAQIRELQTRLETTPDRPELGDRFESEADYVAVALGNLARTRTQVDREVVQALEQIIEFTEIDTTSEPGYAVLGFCVLVPADRRIARLGPIRARVPNRAYPTTTAHDARPDLVRLVVERRYGPDELADRLPHTSVHAVLEQVVEALIANGFTRLAAGTLVRSRLRPLYAIVAHQLYDAPLPADLDPTYVEHCLRIYRDVAFGWNPRVHTLDPRPRQQLLDTVRTAGGRLTVADLRVRLPDSYEDAKIAIYSRPQPGGRAHPWMPCVSRWGPWGPAQPATNHGVAVIPCPHCGGQASRVVRNPETTACLLCPTCRRMPQDHSPVFPTDYLDPAAG